MKKEVNFNSIQDIEKQIQRLKQEKKDLLTKKRAIFGKALELMLKEKVIDREIANKYLDRMARTNTARALINLPKKQKESEVKDQELKPENIIDIDVNYQELINNKKQLEKQFKI